MVFFRFDWKLDFRLLSKLTDGIEAHTIKLMIPNNECDWKQNKLQLKIDMNCTIGSLCCFRLDTNSGNFVTKTIFERRMKTLSIQALNTLLKTFNESLSSLTHLKTLWMPK